MTKPHSPKPSRCLPQKRRRAREELFRGSPSEAEDMFFNEPLLVVEDPRHSQNEHRLHALGQTRDQRLLHITFTLREQNTLIRIISARPMHRKERDIYAQAAKDHPAI